MHSMLMRFMQEELKSPGPLDEDKAGLDTKNFMELCRAIKDVSQANRFNQDYVTNLRVQIAKEEREKAMKAVEGVMKTAPGMTEETMQAIRVKLGVA